MNVVIIDCFDTWEHRVDLLHKVLTEEGHNVTCLISDFKHIEKVRRTEEKVDTIFFTAEPYRKNISVERLHSHAQLSADMFAWVEKHSSFIDLLWVLVPPNSFVADAVKVKRKHNNIRLVIDLIDLWPETMPMGKLKKVMIPWKRLRDENLRAADVVVTECNLYEDVLRRVLDGCRVETLYLARVDKGYEPKLSLPEDQISLCYLGSINNIIDIDTIGRIIEQCKVKPVLLHIIGDGEKKEELKSVAEDAGAVVIDHGKVYDREKKQKIFDSCHYGLNIMKESVCVGLTMKSIDYFEFGLPVINNIKGDTWKIITVKSAGINYMDIRKELSIQDAIQNNLNQRKAARLFFERYLSFDSFASKVRKVVSACNWM